MNHSSKVFSHKLTLPLITVGCFLIFSPPPSYANPESLKNGPILCFTSDNQQVKVCESHPLNFNQNYLKNNLLYKYSEVPLKSKDVGGDVSGASILNYIQTPPEDKDYGTIVLSILAILISIVIPVWQRFVQKKDSINEGFWIREVVMPKINSSVYDVCTAFRTSLILEQSLFTDVYRNDLLPLLNELRDSFTLLTAFPKAVDCSDILNEYCDNFEDKVMDNIEKPIRIRREDISWFHLNITKELISIHGKIS